MTRNTEVGDKVTHPAHGSDLGTVTKIWADGSMEVQFSDGEYGVPSGSLTVVEKTTAPAPSARFRPVRPEKFRLGPTHAEFEAFLRANATIRVQSPGKSAPSFEAKYRSVTGETVVFPSPFASLIGDDVDKRAYSITILFPEDGRRLVPAWLTVGTNDITTNAPAIFNNEFAWELFSKGFRIGSKHEQHETALVYQQ